MNKSLTKLFTDTDISWKRVLLFSVLCGVIPGVLMIPEFLNNTSFQQPGISFEFWIFTALIFILNAKNPKEAALKTFVFFLISQPVIYLVQVPFSPMHWSIFSYYPRWGKLTLCTLPGAFIAWFVKKDNLLSVFILNAANLVLCYELPAFAASLINSFPRYLITVLFIVFELIFFTLLLFKDSKKKILSFVLILILLAASVFYHSGNTFNKKATYSEEIEGVAPFEILSDIPGTEISTEGNTLSVTVDYDTSFPIDLKDANGNIFTIEFVCRDGQASWKK